MPRIRLPESNEWNLFKVATDAYAPEIGTAASAYSLAVYQHSRLTCREVEAARYRTAQLNGCKICQASRGAVDIKDYLAQNGRDAARSPLSRGPAPDEAFYAAVSDWATSPLFSERERLAIELADRMGQRPHSMEHDESFWQRMHAAYGDRDIFDLTTSIASWIALGRIAHTLQFDEVCITAPATAGAAANAA